MFVPPPLGPVLGNSLNPPHWLATGGSKCITVVGCPLMSLMPKSKVVANEVLFETASSKYWRSVPQVATRLLRKSHWPVTKTLGLMTVTTEAGGRLVRSEER